MAHLPQADVNDGGDDRVVSVPYLSGLFFQRTVAVSVRVTLSSHRSFTMNVSIPYIDSIAVMWS